MKKVLALTMAAIMCVAFTACGTNQPANDTTTPAAAGDSGQQQPAEASTSAPESTPTAEGGTLVFYGFSDWMDSEPFKEHYEAAVAKFEAENPGFTVQLQSDPWGDWDQKYRTMFVAGQPADVFYIGNDTLAVFANSGNLLDMDSYVESGYFDSFFPGVENMYVWQGAKVAIPFTTDCRILWYNKEIFTEAGLDPETPPTTWDELVSMANQITQNTGKYGFGMDLGLTEPPTQSLFCASDGSFINVADDGSITPNVDTKEFRGYMQALLDMKGTFQPDYTVQNHHDVAKLFVEGQMGIIIGNTLDGTGIYDKDWYGQALVPSIDGKTNGSYGGGFGISVSNKTKYPEQAVKFAQIICSPEFCGDLISDIPASEAGVENCDKAKDPNYAVYFEQIKYARQGQPKTLYFSEFEKAVYDMVCEVLVGGKSIDNAVSELEAQIIDIAK